MAQQRTARRKAQISKIPVAIPDKLYFRIGDVARLCTLPAYVLRFWETEFPQLKPNKGGTGQRLYRQRDVQVVLEIKRLLYDEGFTIPGARRLLIENRRTSSAKLEPHPVVKAEGGSEKKAQSKIAKAAPRKPQSAKPEIKELRQEMRDLLALLGSGPIERKPVPVAARRDTKKSRLADEPTLF